MMDKQVQSLKLRIEDFLKNFFFRYRFTLEPKQLLYFFEFLKSICKHI